MKDNKENNYPINKQSNNTYDDGDIPQVDLPQDLHIETIPNKNIPTEVPPHPASIEMPNNIIPDEVPRKDGPGGESGKN